MRLFIEKRSYGRPEYSIAVRTNETGNLIILSTDCQFREHLWDSNLNY